MSAEGQCENPETMSLVCAHTHTQHVQGKSDLQQSILWQ